MSDIVLYCRLCAELKPVDTLFDLQLNSVKEREIIDKLGKLNTTSLDFSSADNLPKTICFVCKDTLDKMLNFITQIHQAQHILRDIFINKIIKIESDANERKSETNDSEIINEKRTGTVTNVKLEYDYDLSDGDNTVFEAITTIPRKFHKKKKKNKIKTLQDILEALDDNDVPLSKLKCSTWKDYPWICFYCGSQFFTINELQTHSMELHNSCMPYKCIDCNDNIRKSLNRFIIHVSSHKKHLKLCCYLCNEEFTSKDEINLHKTEHANKNKIQCTGCNMSFENCTALSDHMLRYYRNKKKSSPISCDVCQKVFVNRGNLNKHQQIHTERRREFTCEKCGKTFYDKGSLSSHMLLHQDTRNFKCEICKAGFRTGTQLRTHVGIHGGPKPYSCDQCGRTFRLQTHLKSHLIIHTDSLPHICAYCGKAFRFKTILTQHLRQHTGIKPYCCEHCLREFTNWPNYNKHMKRRHNINTAKKKHTPEGVFPINPLTGQILPLPDSSKTEEWRKKVMEPRQRGRPKLSALVTDIKVNGIVENLDMKDKIVKDESKVNFGSIIHC